MNICVFCSASEIAEKYTKPAAEFAKLLGEHGHTLVWGGSDKGIMKVIASGVQDAGGKIVGISVEFLKEHTRRNADEMIIAKTLGERREAMLERADAIVAMVGGIGTLDEVTEVLELKKHGVHKKPIVILSTGSFYEGLKQQLEKMEKEGFLRSAKIPLPLDELIYFADTPKDAMRYIEAHGN
ncbi:MAG: TIGR00730 family Rossman fold protein [bacterium]|nr:TIGR00730 family Rossman fold protein [bacterium]